MAVRYKLTKINDNITDNKTVKYSVTTVSYDNVNLDALAEQYPFQIFHLDLYRNIGSYGCQEL